MSDLRRVIDTHFAGAVDRFFTQKRYGIRTCPVTEDMNLLADMREVYIADQQRAAAGIATVGGATLEERIKTL